MMEQTEGEVKASGSEESQEKQAESNVSSTSEDEWEVEEQVVVATVSGVYDTEGLKNLVATGHTKVIDAHTQRPLIMIGKTLLEGKWERVFGTDLLFSQRKGGGGTELVGASDRRLVATEVSNPVLNKTAIPASTPPSDSPSNSDSKPS